MQEKGADDLHLWTYDEIIRLLDEVESGKVEKKCSKKDCAKIDRFLVLLAKEGASADNSSLDRDITKLVPEKQFCDANPHALRTNFGDGISSSIAFINADFASYFTLKTFPFISAQSSNWKNTKKFIHKHKKAIIIGVTIVVAVVVVVTVIVMTSATANNDPSQSEIKEALDGQLEPIKALATDNTNDSSFNNKTRELGAALAHLSLQKLTSSEGNEFGHEVIDQEFKTNHTSPELDPTNAKFYLDRSVSNLSTGDYKKSLEDYTTYTIQAPESASTSILEFSKGFAKGLPKGVHDSAEDMAHLASDLATHPIRTSAQVYESLKQLKELASSGEWKDLSQTLAPEVYELITHWDDLSSTERGDLSGYVFGKYGSDIIIPGAAAKIIARGAKASKILNHVRNSCEVAERTLVLESAAATKAAVLAEDLGTAVSEIKTGGLNTTTKTIEHLTPEMQISHYGLTLAQKEHFLISTSSIYDQNLTVLAHSFSKHAGRHPETWGELKGPMSTWHNQAIDKLNNICDAPGNFIKVIDSNTGLQWIEKRLSDGSGVRLNQDYTFKGFID